MALKGRSKREIQRGVDSLTPMGVGNVRGDWYERWEDVPQGRLPSPYRERVLSALRGQRVYVIFSYETPIAWWVHDEWIIPDIKYSPTTTNHQNVVSVATANSGFYADAKW